MSDKKKRLIDVAGLIESKNPKLKKRLPKFVINWLTRIIHQDEVNEFMFIHRDKKNADFCDEVMRYFNISVQLHGVENVPREGGFVLAANHPLAGFDALAIVSELKGVREDIKFIVNDLLMNITNLSGLFVGVNKHGSSSVESRNKVNELFASENVVLIFPAGLVSRQTKGEIRDPEWKKTFVMLAKKNNKPILPVFIKGRLTNRFYRLSRWRKRLGIKMNFEMLFLSDEFFKQKNTKIDIIFGKPIYPDFFSAEKTDAEWAAYLNNLVHDMGKDHFGTLK
jgi:putative hemolysin